ncbi:P-loop NTPase fold protein [Amycolatopsis sp. NPDC021455]|uniref:P-loop NTPase fold protein n=1 Tax=Amycolatopsis sp. NPDC021455 TaxID=3154901 RepID=UPI0033FF5295
MTISLVADFPARFAELPASTQQRVLTVVQALEKGDLVDSWSVVGADPRARIADLDDAWSLVLLEITPGDYLLLRAHLRDQVENWVLAQNFDRFRSAKTVGVERILPGRNSERARLIPGFAGETTSGTDRLGITYDARALAALLAAKSLQPPLAVGLYGEWGTGKTFFMRTLEAEITSLDSLSCCHNVAHVWFNAWHYAEGNLWASLVHHIFVSLHHDDSPQEKALTAALDRIQGIQQTKDEALAQVNSAAEAVAAARGAVERLESEREAALEKTGAVTAKDVWTTIEVDPELRGRLTDAAEQLGLTGIGESARELARTAKDIRDTVRRSGILATARPWWRSPLVLGLFAGVVIWVAGIAVTAATGWVQPWLAPVTAALGGAVTWLTSQARRLRELLAPAERIQAELDTRVAEAEAAYQAKVAEARQRFETTEADLAAARTALLAAEQREAAAQADLGELAGSRLLERYLSERASSDDYRRHLGVVALAHQDLSDLDAYLRAALEDETAESPIDRIVLYIDDLDRCSPETVVRVLEAVHLLLALPMFVVVLGVDPNWLTRSIRARQPGEGPARQYLEKIFQLTYRLPPMNAATCADLLQHTAEATQPEPPAADLVTPPSGFELPAEIRRTSFARGFGLDHTEALALTDSEIRQIRLVAPLVGTSPRRAKRFVNVYRISKARVLGEPGNHLADQAVSGLIVLVALLLGTRLPLAAVRPDDDRTLAEWVTADCDAPGGELVEFLGEVTELATLPMTAVVRHLPQVERFTWQVA